MAKSKKKTKQTTKQIGGRLEDAVRELEKWLIEKYNIPGEADIAIEPNYTYELDGGAKREVDLYIKVKHGEHFEATYIYECKNWKRPVKPEQVAYFQRKVEELGATKGFIIGKSFTKGCYAEEQKDKRLELVKATELNIDPGQLANVDLHYFVTEPKAVIAFVGVNGVIKPVSPDNLFADEDGSIIGLKEFGERLFGVEKAIKDEVEKILKHRQEGVIPVDLRNFVDLAPGDFIFEDVEIRKILVAVQFEYYFTTGRFISHFDIEKRGRILQRVLINHLGEKISVTGINLGIAGHKVKHENPKNINR